MPETTPDIDWLPLLFGLVGGLALFLFGIGRMADALRAAAGDGLRILLRRLTTNRFSGAAVGAVVTGLIQSSTVTTVLVVGFVSAGLMTVSQSVGVILGANIGSTMTAQIIAFRITDWALPLVAVGFALGSFARRDRIRQLGMTTMGLGMLFLGMDLMSGAAEPLRDYPPFVTLMARMDIAILGVLVGALFTGVVQSSAATAGVVILLAGQGLITLDGAIAVMLGANIGTCGTALLATIGRTREALQAALVHLIVNVVGVLMWIFLISQLADLSRAISPTAENLEGLTRVAAEVPRQVANAHTLFNIINTFILIWFVGPIGRLAVWMAPSRPVEEPPESKPRYLDRMMLDTPAIALDHIRLELGHLGEVAGAMVDAAPSAILRGNASDVERVASMDDTLDRLHEAIVLYTRDLGRHELTTAEARRLEQLLAAATVIEGFGDVIATNLVAVGRQRVAQGIRFSEGTLEALKPLHAAATGAFHDAVRALVERDAELATSVRGRKAEVRALVGTVLEHLRRRLAADEPDRVGTFRLEVDAVTQMERLFDLSRRLARLAVELGGAAEPTADGA